MSYQKPFTKEEIQENLSCCPFCGSVATRDWYSGAPIIMCIDDGCLASMGGGEYEGTARMLIDSWNKRITK